MNSDTVRHNRWKIAIAILLALCIGTLAGSFIAAKSGRPIFGGTTPMWVAAARPPVPVSEVSFANGFSAVATKDLPAVVNIATSKIVRNTENNNLLPFFNDPFFQQFFGHEFQIPREQRERSLGSGVIVNADGYILTNNHVVSGATQIKVTLGDKREFSAKIIGTDPRSDIAVVKVNATNLPVMVLGNSANVRVGDFCLAIGSPFGLSQTVTMGIISAKGRGNLGIEDY